jgi:hypothetical protein
MRQNEMEGMNLIKRYCKHLCECHSEAPCIASICIYMYIYIYIYIYTYISSMIE